MSSIILLTHNGSSHLDQFLSKFFGTLAFKGMDLTVIDRGSSDNIREVLQKYATHDFIRFIQCRKDDSPGRIKVLAERKSQSLDLIYIDINQTGIKCCSDFPDLQSGTREEADQIKERLVTYLRGYSPEERVHQDVFLPLPEQKILFVLPEGIDSKHGYQASLLARMLQTQGVQCTIAVPDASLSQISSPTTDHRSPITVSYSSLLTSDLRSLTSGPPDIIHAWTPRENVRKVCEALLERTNCHLIIHLMENEEYLTEIRTGKHWFELVAMPAQELDKIIPDDCYHPVKGRAFINKAHGLTMVVETLNRFNFNDVPTQIVPPLVDESLFYPRPVNMDLRKKYNIQADTIVLAYAGNVHAANLIAVEELYKAVSLLNEKGRPTVILRIGIACTDLGEKALSGKEHEVFLGWVNRQELPEILATADIFFQPGEPGPFDDQRVPAKLPEYFAMGRPVILSRTNLGLKVEHGKEGYVLGKADARSIAEAVENIWGDPKQREIISYASVDFYLDKCFVPLHQLHQFYQTISNRIQ
jgi:glycosyltransferase involved in cell wall biosynthesis